MSEKTIIYTRFLKLLLPDRKSAFLWGARQTGKSTYLRMHFPDAHCYDLLQSDHVDLLLDQPKKAIVVSLDAAPRLLKVDDHSEIHILPWAHFLKKLWNDAIV